MSHLRPYSLQSAIFEAFIRPVIGAPRYQLHPRYARAFANSSRAQQKLSRKQRESGAPLTPEDQARILKAQRKAAERAEKVAAKSAIKQGNSAKRLLQIIKQNQELEAAGTNNRNNNNNNNNGGKPTQVADMLKKVEENRPPENEEIEAEVIDLIDLEGRYTRKVYLSDVLSSLNRDEEKVLLVKSNGGGIPVCRIFTIKHILEKKRRVQGRAADRAKGERSSKELELTWTIGPADLDLKCRTMVRFLEEGRKVSVTVARRWKWQVPDKTDAELEGLVQMLREAVKRVEGAKEVRQPDGALGATVELCFEGPKGGIKEERREADVDDLPEPEIAGAAAS